MTGSLRTDAAKRVSPLEERAARQVPVHQSFIRERISRPSSNRRCSMSTGTSQASGRDCWRSPKTRTSQLYLSSAAVSSARAFSSLAARSLSCRSKAPRLSISAARAFCRCWKRSTPFITMARSVLMVLSRPANSSLSASSRLSCGCAAAYRAMAAAASSRGTRRLASTAMSFPISSLLRQSERLRCARRSDD